MAVHTTSSGTCYNVLDADSNIIASFNTEEEAEAKMQEINDDEGYKAANALAATYNTDIEPDEPYIEIRYSLKNSGSLADLNTALEAIKTEYGIEPDPEPAP